MKGLNKTEIIGNVGTEPELRFTPSGQPVANFRVAVDRKYTSNGETKEETQWFSIVAWNKLAEICNQYISKGMLLYISGRVSLKEWEGQDGKLKSRLELSAQSVIFLSRNSDTTPDIDHSEPDDIPF